jgi:hypothetical protein
MRGETAASSEELKEGGAQGVRQEAVCAVLGARGALEEPLDVAKDCEEEAAVAHRLCRRPKLQLASGKGLRVCCIVLS